MITSTDAECASELHRLKISWSQLQAHTICKQRAMLQRRGGRSPITDIRNFFHGTVCDRVMRAWLESDDQRAGQMPQMVDDYMERCLDEAKENGEGVVRWKTRTDKKEVATFCKALLTRLEPMLQQLVLPYEYQPELRFKVPIRIPYLDGHPAEIDLVGGIDIAVRRSVDPARWFAYDLKATRNPDYVRKTLGQGIFYDIAMLAMFGKSPEEFAFLQPAVDSNPIVPIRVSNDDRVSMLARIKEVAHDRWRGDDAPTKDTGACSWCSVKFACVKFSTSATVFAPVRGRSAALRSAG
jgi:PD-(D/E)XK nuclease superfamily